MNISIKLSSKDEKQIVHLKNYLDKSGLDELTAVEIKRKPAKPGQMGPGLIMGEISAAIAAAQSPLTKLVEALIKYIESFKTEIILKNDNGQELLLNTKKIDKEGIYLLVETFLGKPKTTRKKAVEKK